MSGSGTVRFRGALDRISRGLLDGQLRRVVASLYVAVNLVLIGNTIALGPHVAQDWALWTAVGEGGNPYRTDTAVPFVWSPVMAPIMSAVVAIGYWPWLTAHVASVLLLRKPMLIGLILVSVGFWFDAAQGNTLTFSLVAGVFAAKGSRWGSLAYLALLILMPRPLVAPLGLWLLWRDRSLWVPVAGMFVVHLAAVVASGWAVPWFDAMMSYSGPPPAYGLAALLGAWWLPIAVPMAAWLIWRGNFGWAGLAISPYVLPQYLVWPLVELSTGRSTAARRDTPTRFNEPTDAPASVPP